MTEEELLEKYGRVQMSYARLYKYNLYARGNTDEGIEIEVTVNLQECYRGEFNLNRTFLLEELPISEVYVDGELVYEAW